LKRVWFAAALLLLLAGSGILVSGTIGRLVDHSMSLINDAEALVRQDNFKAAGTVCAEAADHWKGHNKTFSAFLRHDETDAVEISIARLQVFADIGDKDDFLALCVELLEELRHIRDMEKPLPWNIM